MAEGFDLVKTIAATTQTTAALMVGRMIEAQELLHAAGRDPADAAAFLLDNLFDDARAPDRGARLDEFLTDPAARLKAWGAPEMEP